jgi:hypothetical protein
MENWECRGLLAIEILELHGMAMVLMDYALAQLNFYILAHQASLFMP